MILRFIVLLILDQLSKQFFYWTSWNFLLLDGQVGFMLQLNDGVAFSIPIPSWVTIPLALMVVCALILLYLNDMKRSSLAKWSVSLVLAGAVGNLIDRVFVGAVIDFIKVFEWPTFNLADSYLVVGIFLLMVFWERVSLK